MQGLEEVKHSDIFKAWDSSKRCPAQLIQFAYDFLYPDHEEAKPDREIRAELIEFLHYIK